jgi:RNA polymerase sigma factor (sigma-70 family)
MSEAAVPSGLGSGAVITRVLSDDRLAQRAVKGDGRAFAAIFRRYHQSLYRFCLAIVGDPQDAQDALQNTMVKVLRALPGEERQIELKPWLYRIALDESIELLRRRRETRQLDPELAMPGSGLAEEAASRERLRRLISDLDELPERQRETLACARWRASTSRRSAPRSTPPPRARWPRQSTRCRSGISPQRHGR